MTEQKAIYAKIPLLLIKLFEADPRDIRPKAYLCEDLELDSIDAVDMIVHLQKKAGKKIKPEESKAVRTVQDVVGIVERLPKEAQFSMSSTCSLPVVQLLISLLLLVWPFLTWFDLAHNSLHWLLPLMALLLLLRFRQTRRQAGLLRAVIQAVAVAGITLCIASYLLKTHQLLLFYPVVVSTIMLSASGRSLWLTMPVIGRLA